MAVFESEKSSNNTKINYTVSDDEVVVHVPPLHCFTILHQQLTVDIGCPEKKVLHKSEEKMKMTSQRAENLVHIQQHHGKSFYKKISF